MTSITSMGIVRNPIAIHIHIRKCAMFTLTIQTFIIAMATSLVYPPSSNDLGQLSL